MKFSYKIFILFTLVLTIYGDKCGHSKCPTDCEFGITHEKDQSNCKKCVCSPDPCLVKKCPALSVCKARKDPQCKHGDHCKYKTQAHCVSETKDGVCPILPVVVLLKNQKPKDCSSDYECLGTNKCCKSHCVAPCQTTRCTCTGNTVVNYHTNARGCSVCSCITLESQNPCVLPKVVGNCKASIKKFYYDSQSKNCKEFKYGGCGGNANRFDSKEACMKKCELKVSRIISNNTDDESCSQPKEAGKCKQIIQRYYYDSNKKSCEKFNYTGCDANQNNFLTLNDCESKCLPKETSPVDVCSLPQVVGKCKASFQRFYYDSSKQTCKEFIYSGCDANENNFETKEACSNRCERKQIPNAGNNLKVQQIQTAQPVKVDKCMLPVSKGDCRAIIKKYHFDLETKSCKEFNYGGCGGNDNRFDSVEDCTKECITRNSISDKLPNDDKKDADVVISIDICTVPSDSGLCEGYFPRYFYNQTQNTCEEFVYGGCGGNPNNFLSQEDCMAVCGKKVQIKDEEKKDETNGDDCAQPKEVGKCRASIPRFYYNSQNKKCESFLFGGCNANGNNFETLEACEAKCVKKNNKVNICKQQKDSGLCKAYFKKFYYDSEKKKCQEFVYGGCGGNDNNFETLKECENKCLNQ